MVTRRLFISIVISAFCVVVFAQDTHQKRGLLRSQGTIGTGLMTNHQPLNIYLHGTLGIYFSEKVAFFSDTYYYVDNQKEGKTGIQILENHSTFAGLSFHLKEGSRFDPFISLQPGASFVRLSKSEGAIEHSKIEIDPLFGVGGGINYYVSNFFHFFFLTKYVHGHHLSPEFPIYRLNSFRFSGGLGINFHIFDKPDGE